MSRIKALDPHVANLIAAGEVVERPASVVKELMENAIDAGATTLTVEIQNGGMRLIRVTDNGAGIALEDAEIAFLRHATSKLETAQDLESIQTLGFRGEALAAIASVSRVELFTRTAEAQLGLSLTLEGGVLQEREEVGCPFGTTILVRDLFFNTPARLKFMKRDAAEGASAFAIVQRVALAHPELSVKFLRDGKQELFTPGDHKLSSVLYSVFGRDLALGLSEVTAEQDGMRIEGFVSLPACCRGTRGYQHFILNGRPIRSPLLVKALEEAYTHQKMVGKFPACVLHLHLRPGSVDVNVHPAKTEVKFLFERTVFDAVLYAVLAALDQERRHPLLDMPPPKPSPSPSSKPTASLPLRDSMQVAQPLTPPLRVHPLQQGLLPLPPLESPESPPQAKPSRPSVAPAPVEVPLRPSHVPSSPPPLDALSVPVVPVPSVEPPQREPLVPEETAPWRLAGEVMDTYLIVEQGETIHLIDKHAAHERLQFDRLRAEDYQPMAQNLLTPLTLSLPPEERAALLQHEELLESCGFLLEPFGGDVLLLRQIPADLSLADAEETLSALAHGLLVGLRLSPQKRRDEILHTVACKAAIKGGQKSAPEELQVLAQAVMDGLVKYCPHGRPVAVTLTRAQLERRFGRA